MDQRLLIDKLVRDNDRLEKQLTEAQLQVQHLHALGSTTNRLLVILLGRLPAPEDGQPTTVIEPEEIAAAERWVVQVHSQDDGKRHVYLLRTDADYAAAREREKEIQERRAIREKLVSA